MAAPKDRRASRRSKTFEVVSLSVDGVSHRAHLLDVCAEGAQVHSRIQLNVSQEVTLRADGSERRTTVKWLSDSGRGGLSFRKD